ncbi:hypothetical protein FNV43_RR01092 [Rhamnella rubrinervis]|uniref:WAT1-related protein n=1 Tax=Rhamnella rubrinervis TaxID=2594499 RepID=A0A8K0MRZ4_9ROSA|nr:hypothetical protein FNV43_RR01092 [Rhamnella rubrinervis]
METRKPKTRNGFQGGHELKGCGSSGPPEKRFAGDNGKVIQVPHRVELGSQLQNDGPVVVVGEAVTCLPKQCLHLRKKIAPWFFATLLPLMLGVNLFLIKLGLEHGMEIPVYQVYKNVIGAALLLPHLWMRRLETVKINERRSQIKLFGITVLTGGSIMIGLYNGIALTVSSSPVKPPHLDANWERAKTMEIIRDPFAVAVWTSLCAVSTNALIALILESRTSYSWLTFRAGQRIYIYFYGGLIIAISATYMQARVTKHKGIMVLQSFSPLSVVFVVIFSTAFLGQHLVLGRLVGAVLVISGIALILVGRSKLMGPQVPQVMADNVENVVEAATGDMPNV